MKYPHEAPLWRRYLRFWRRNVQADIDDELHFHFQTRIDELVGQGLTPEAARAQALQEFGDVTDVRSGLQAIDQRMAQRESRGEWLDAWRQDLVYAARSLRRTPGVTITIIVTLALGLGVNTAMFSLLNAVFLRPPGGVVRPEQMRRLWSEAHFRSGRQFWPGYDYSQYRAIRESLDGLGRTTVYRNPTEAKLGRGAAASHAMLSYAASDYFPLLGVRPALGRFFTADEDQLGAGQKVAVARHGFWRRALGGDSAALGRPLILNGEPYTLIGVTDPAFSGVDLDATDLWVPLSSITGYGSTTPWWTNPGVNGFQILVRVVGGVRDESIEARTTLLLRRHDLGQRIFDSTSVTRTGSIITARGPGKKVQEVEIATRLGGVALVVLLIACANVVNLLLARAVRRRREIAMRLALGISRGRLARLVLTESVLLALAAGVAAILAAQWGGLALRTILLPDVHWARTPLDWRVLTGALAAAILAGLVAGAAPTLQSGSTELTEVLKAGAREGHARPSRARAFLVATQAALSVMLLVGAALFVRSLSNVRALGLGFDANRLLFARVRFDTKDAARDSLTPARLAEVASRLRGTAGIQGTALTAMRPMSGFSTASYFPDADTIVNKKPMGMFWAVSPEYFATAGTRILAGSGFPAKDGSGTPPSVIVNSAMAQALWPGENALGRCVRFEEPNARCNPVIGVVETARWGQVIEESTPQFYLPLGNMPFSRWAAQAIAVRSAGSSTASVAGEVRAALKQAFPGAEPVVEQMSAVLEPKYRPWRLGATLFSLFGILAAVVAAIGVYSTVSYSVNQRTHEFGVRVALGARLGDVVRHLLAESLRIVAIGVAIGVALSLLAGRLIASLLYGIAPHDPAAISLVVMVLLVVATVATLLPAWRAARVDPMIALRVE